MNFDFKGKMSAETRFINTFGSKEVFKIILIQKLLIKDFWLENGFKNVFHLKTALKVLLTRKWRYNYFWIEHSIKIKLIKFNFRLMLEPQKVLSAYRWDFIPTISLPMLSRENLKSSFQKNFTLVSISMTIALWSCNSKNAGPLHRKFFAQWFANIFDSMSHYVVELKKVL